MKSYIYIFLFPLFIAGIFGGPVSAQTVRKTQINFKLENLSIFNDTIMFNDTMMLMTLRFREDASSGGSLGLKGTITLSLCGCYCDSIWDAWPRGAGGSDNILGTGTMTYLASTSSTGGAVFNPGSLGNGGPVRNRGIIGIRQITGGIPRNSDYEIPMTFTLD